MIIATLKEEPDTRVAITPNSAKQYLSLGLTVLCENNAGALAGFSDKDYEAVGSKISTAEDLKQADILICVDEPPIEKIKQLKPKSLIVAPIDNNPESEFSKFCLEKDLSVFSMNKVPRITRAQNIDSLSSQANLAGYKAVIEAANYFHEVIPMMMTAAGMIHPAKVLVLGAGVAGLQAIATAKRIGAVVYAFDVRKAAKEQVESVGGEFIEVATDEDAQTKEGYAKEVSEEYKQKQKELIDEYAKQADIVICTALIPDKKAPILLYESTVKAMKPGSIVVDLATSRGGNCEVSEVDKVINYNQVTIIGYSNMAARLPRTASNLYANNLLNLIKLICKDNNVDLNPEDEIIQHALLIHDKQYLPYFKKGD